jgi:hypothetical protein
MHNYQVLLDYLITLINSMSSDIRGNEALQADKEEKQLNQKDHERRSMGTIPDAILSLDKYDVPFALVEVSGPPNQANHQHFVGDKIKLAKHLKSCLKKIRRTINHGDEGLYEHIKLFGIHVHCECYVSGLDLI